MAYIFHQNMRVFGGGTAHRNSEYAASFERMHRQVSPVYGPCLVAGYTEIKNPRSSHVALNNIAQTCFGHNFAFTVRTRRTASDRGEYLTITTDIPDGILGRIYLNDPGFFGRKRLSIQTFGQADDGGGAGWAEEYPEDGAIDYQALVFYVIEVNGTWCAIAFAHNVHSVNGGRAILTGLLDQVPQMIKDDPIVREFTGLTDADILPVFLGGDWNIDFRDQRDLRYQAMGLQSTRADITNTWARVSSDQKHWGVKPGGTTSNGDNLYDFWFSNVTNQIPATGGARQDWFRMSMLRR